MKIARETSTNMPSVKLKLGPFVAVRKRADGTHRVLFEVPARLRPSGWLPTIPLPIEGRAGNLGDAAEVARIQADALKLYDRYLIARAGGDLPAAPGRNIATLIDAWQKSEAYRATKSRTQEGYSWLATKIEAWAEAAPRASDPVAMLRGDVETFLRRYDNRPSLKWHMRKVLRLVMDQAVALGWRQDNPVDGVRVKQPTGQVTIWEQADVEAYVAAADAAGQRWLGALILTEWEIGQRLTDAILFRRGAEYEAAEGMFRFRQSKTLAYVTIPVSDRLRASLAASAVDGSPYLFHDGATGRPFPDVGRLGHVFEAVRDKVLADGGRRLVLRALRHSCVVQLARCGCTVPEIASITGHSIATVESILSIYLPRDSVVALNAQRKRGLVKGEAS